MTQANDGFVRTPDGAGTTLATHLVNGKEYPVGMIAGPGGHIEGSLDTYLLSIPPQAVGASKIHFDLFNAHASAVIKVRGAWVIVAQDVAVTGLVSVRLDWFATSAVGTAGTAATADASTIVPTLAKKDTGNAAIPAGITARAAPTGGATNARWLFPSYHQTEETSMGGALSQFNNVLPNPDRGEQEFVLRLNQGLSAKQGTVAGVGTIGFLVSLTIE